MEFDYKQLFPNHIIKPGDILYISSDLLFPMWIAKKNQEQFIPEHLLETLQSLVGADGTILVPTYNFDFSNKGYYDIRHSKSMVGSLGNTALEHPGFRRTSHPIHSFAVWGKYQSELCELNNLNSFGSSTPFEFMFDHHAKEIGIGISDYIKSCTFIHQIEVMANVPYRFIKTFTGTYINEEGNVATRSYLYSARDLSISYSYCSEGLRKILLQDHATHEWSILEIPLYYIDIQTAYPNLYHVLTTLKCEGYIDFSIDRNYLYSDKYIICKD